jgi:ferredoxin, 2Fe-2S
MPKLIVVDRSGSEKEVEATAGVSVMENIRDAGFDELLAVCGGCCSCATCHVIVDDVWIGEVGAPGEEEDALLDSSSHRTAASRLSCQIEMSDKLWGLRVTIAPED